MSEEEFNFGDLDLQMDEGTEARIAHAEFLEKIKEWGMGMGLIGVPFSHMAQAVLQADYEDLPDKEKVELYERVATALPHGASLLVDHVNELYALMQAEAVKVLGAPFKLHDAHHPTCDGTAEHCGHQDHFTGLPEKKEGE
jgi:hypothetical protein